MLETRKQNLGDSIRFVLEDYRRMAGVVFLSALSFILLILSSFPSYAAQMLGDSIFFLGEVVSALTVNMYMSSGVLGVALTAVYSIFTGAGLMVFYSSVRTKGLDNLLRAGSFAPAVLVGGCASCGAGILGLMGFMGAVSFFPFEGNLVRLAGLLLIVYYLSEEGDPGVCNLPSR